jgi:hypothetical protein
MNPIRQSLADADVTVSTAYLISRTGDANFQQDFQAVFATNAADGSDAFGGLEAGVIAAALVMALGCAWELTRRLAEYR